MFRKFSSNNIYCIVTVIFFGLIVLWPSFKLALTGDDYLSLWRFEHSLNNPALNYNYLTYWFTDYGPQDSLTALLYHFVGFKPLTYYLTSFALRIIAAISLMPLINYLTKSRKAALISSIFFAVTLTGIETTDWVFNMPSYIGITFLNLFIYILLLDISKKKISIRSIVLFILTIIAQPIRLSFVPGVVLIIEVLKLKFGQESIKIAFLRTSLLLITFLLIFRYTGIGKTQIIPINAYQDKVGFWGSRIGVYFIAFQDTLTNKNFTFMLNPASYLGLIFLPNNIIPNRILLINSQKLLIAISITAFLFFIVTLLYLKRNLNISQNIFRLCLLLGVFWIICVVATYINIVGPIQSTTFLPLLLGGLISSILISVYSSFQNRDHKIGFLIGISIIALTSFYIWIKNPTAISSSWTRYFIVPAVGLSILVGIIFQKAKKDILFYILFTGFFAIHMYATFTYLYKLSLVRATGFTERLRASIPDNPKFRDENQPLVYYFTTNNESVLYHSLLFGFPVFIAYEHDVNNPWRIAYTTNWNEVVSAYTDGESMKRFMNKVQKVPLENIYSFDLTNHQLTERTNEIRVKLKNYNN